jgi:hypothetical protein
MQAALANEIPLEELRPLACLHVVRAHARDLVDALAEATRTAWARVTSIVGATAGEHATDDSEPNSHRLRRPNP